MREVIPNILWIGNARDAREVKGVLAVGIEVVIDLAIEEPPISFPRDIVYCRFPLLDGEGNSDTLLKSAIDTLAGFISASHPTLVACSGGMSRSPAVASAAYAKSQSIGLNAAVEQVAITGPCDFSPRLWSDVCRIIEKDQKPSTGPALNLFVIRSAEPILTVAFYKLLGLCFQEEQHGEGQIHWAAESGEVVMEVYPARSPAEVNNTIRLGFDVRDLGSIVVSLREMGAQVVSDQKQTQEGLRALVKDPDGRTIELAQRYPY